MRSLLVAVTVLGCSGGSKPAALPPAAPAEPAAAAPASAPAPSGPDPACIAAADQLGAWLGQVVAIGARADTSDAALVKLDLAPGPVPTGPLLVMDPKLMKLGGQLVGSVPITDKGKTLGQAFANLPSKGNGVVFIIDGAVPWSSIVTAAATAVASGRTHASFVFQAGKPSAPPPPPSAIDAELDALAHPDPSKPSAKLADPNVRAIPEKVFKDCPLGEVAKELGAADGPAKGQVIAEGFPKAIKACGCKVEIASVQRLVWAWYLLDRQPELLGVPVILATKGKAVTAAPTDPWSQASAAVLDAAKARTPITLK